MAIQCPHTSPFGLCFLQHGNFIHLSLGPSGQFSCWLLGGSQQRKRYCCPRPNHKHSNTGGDELFHLSQSLSAVVVLAVALLGWMVLSSSALAQGSIHVGGKDAYMLMSSFHLHVLPNLVMVFAQFVNLLCWSVYTNVGWFLQREGLPPVISLTIHILHYGSWEKCSVLHGTHQYEAWFLWRNLWESMPSYGWPSWPKNYYVNLGHWCFIWANSFLEWLYWLCQVQNSHLGCHSDAWWILWGLWTLHKNAAEDFNHQNTQIVREKHNLPVVFDSFVPMLAKRALATTMCAGLCQLCLNALDFFPWQQSR